MTIAPRTKLILLAILAFAFVTRVWRLHIPERYIFDEVYHAVTARLIAENDPRAYEWWHPPPEENTAIDWLHPPLAKYTQAASIRLFGYTSFSWRLSSALFGVGVIWLVFLVSHRVFNDENLALTAAFLSSLDGLLLTQSRVAMNDIHVTAFILLTSWCYWRYRHSAPQKRLWWLLATGVSAGLSMGTKWSGVFTLASIWGWELWRWVYQVLSQHTLPRIKLGELVQKVLILSVLPVCVYLLSFTHMYIQGKGWDHLVGLHQQIYWYQTNLDATHSYQSTPYQWVLDLRPVWYHVDRTQPGKVGNIYALGHPLLQWLGVVSVVLTASYLVWSAFKRTWTDTHHHLLFILGSYFAVWGAWLFSPRIMFYYHYTPAVPFLTMLLAWWLHKLPQFVLVGVLALLGVLFIVWYPHWTAIPLPTAWVDAVYFSLPSWR